MLLTQINNAFLSIKILLADLLTSTNSIDRELGAINKRLLSLEQRQPVIYITVPPTGTIPGWTGTEFSPARPYEVTCCAQDDGLHPSANPPGTTSNHTQSQYVPAPRGERVPETPF